MTILHVLNTDYDSSGAALCGSYGSSKFAVRALTQVAGKTAALALGVYSRVRQPANGANMESQ